jgi:DUF438 domain-containing protein
LGVFAAVGMVFGCAAEGYRPAEAQVRDVADGEGGVRLATGTLTLEQLMGIFPALPVDLTFVDADDRVAFFSEGPQRIFARSRAIIGRTVQNCHPPRSVDVVERILGDFRSGRQSVAEFWIPFTGRFVHIRYFAVRSAEGRYLGTLEVTRDVSKIRARPGSGACCGGREWRGLIGVVPVGLRCWG